MNCPYCNKLTETTTYIPGVVRTCNNHPGIKVKFFLTYYDEDNIEKTIFQKITDKHMICVSLTNKTNIIMYDNDGFKDIVKDFDYVINFTPENIDSKIKTILTFS